MQSGPLAKILVVEDEGTVAADIQSCLERLGYDVVGIADTGEEALDLAHDHQPDLVTMDVILQGPLDGIQTAGRLRKEREIPVVFLTSLSDTLTVQRAKTTAPYAYLIKPFQEQELRLALEIALSRHAAEARNRRYQRAIDAMPVAMVITGAPHDQFPVIDANVALEQWTGYTARELADQQQTLDSVFQSSDPEALHRTLSGDHPEWIPAQLRRKDGSLIWCEAKCTASSDKPGGSPEFTWIFKKINEPTKPAPNLRHRSNLGSFGKIIPGSGRDLNGCVTPVAMALRRLKDRHPDDIKLLEVIETSVTDASETIRTLQNGVERPGGRSNGTSSLDMAQLRPESNLAKGP